MILKMVLLIATLAVFHRDLLADPSEQPKKYQLSIGAIFKNEAKYLKEWIEYHRIVGVDHFYLYNNESRDRFIEVLDPYIRSGIVTLKNWHDFLGPFDEDKAFLWALSTQVSAYENILLTLALPESEWLAFVGVDEYLVPPDVDKLTDILERYHNAPGILLLTDFFDAYKTYGIPKRKLLIETTELVSPPKQNVERSIAKMIFKPEYYGGFIWPPYQCVFREGLQPITIRRPEMRINHYLHRDIGYFYLGKTLFHVDNRTLTDDEISEILEGGYEIDDQKRPIYRFIPELLTRMGYDRSLTD